MPTLNRYFVLAVTAATAATALIPAMSVAQTAPRARADARWSAWLGCWQSDSSTAAQHSADSGTGAITCVVPAAGRAGVEALSIAHGKVTMRERLDGNGTARAIDGQGCKGTESTSWSATGRRVYLRSEYTCADGIKGATNAMFAISSTGEWIRIDEVRSGSGAIVAVDRRRPIALASVLPAEAVGAIEGQRMLVTTARAAASAPITPDEIIDATHNVGAGVVSAWLSAARQRFSLDGQQMAALVHADLPASVLQAMMRWNAQDPSQYPADAPALQRSSGVYTNGAVYGDTPALQHGRIIREEQVPAEYGCVPAGCYAPNVYSEYNGYSLYDAYGYPVVRAPIVTVAPYPYGYIVPGAGNHGVRGSYGRDQNYGGGRPPMPQGPVGVRPTAPAHQPVHQPSGYQPAPAPQQPAAHPPTSRPRTGPPK